MQKQSRKQVVTNSCTNTLQSPGTGPAEGEGQKHQTPVVLMVRNSRFIIQQVSQFTKKKKKKVDIFPSLTSWFPDLWHNPILPWLTHNQFSFVQATAASRHSESQSTLPASSVFHDSLITKDCLCVEIFPLGVSDSRIISRQKEPKSEKGTCSHPNPLELIQKHLSQRLYSKHAVRLIGSPSRCAVIVAHNSAEKVSFYVPLFVDGSDDTS